METKTVQIFDRYNYQVSNNHQSSIQDNVVGLVGFVMSIVGLVLCWVPILKWILLIPAFILSIIGLFKKPRALAIVGTVITTILILSIGFSKLSFWLALL